MEDMQKFLLWLVLILISTAGITTAVGQCHQKVTGVREVNWHYNMTMHKKVLVTLTRVVGTTLWFIIFFSPVYLEFPNLIGDPVVATVEDGKLVYHPWGLFDPPWKWDEQVVVNTYSLSYVYTEGGLTKDVHGKCGTYSWWIDWEISDIETWYIHRENTMRAVRRSLLQHILEMQPSLEKLDMGPDVTRQQLCDRLQEEFREEGARRGAAITHCNFYFNPNRE